MCLRTPHSVLLGKEAEETKKVPESIYSQTLCNRKNSNRSKAITDTDINSISYLFLFFKSWQEFGKMSPILITAMNRLEFYPQSTFHRRNSAKTFALLQVVYRFCEMMIAIRDTWKLHTAYKPLIRFPVISLQ